MARLRTILLNTLAGWLYAGANWIRRRAEAATEETSAVSAADQEAAVRQPDEPPAHWLERVQRSGRPPAHWLEYVRDRVPGLFGTEHPRAAPSGTVRTPSSTRSATPQTEAPPPRSAPQARLVEHEAAVVPSILEEELAPSARSVAAGPAAREPPPAPIPREQQVEERRAIRLQPRPTATVKPGPAKEPLSSHEQRVEEKTPTRLQPRPTATAEPGPVTTEPEPVRPASIRKRQPPAWHAPTEEQAAPPPSYPAAESVWEEEGVPHRGSAWSLWPTLPQEKPYQQPHEPQPDAADGVARPDPARDRAEPTRWANVEIERVATPPAATPESPRTPERRIRTGAAYQLWERPEDRWPALPDEEPVAAEDWEAELRAWQRLRRLEREQRGLLWNESPF